MGLQSDIHWHRIPIDNWKISVEYSPEATWYQNVEKVSSYTIKGGYMFVNNDDIQFGCNLGIYYLNSSGPKYHYGYNNDLTIGLESTFKLSDQCKLNLSYDSYLSGNAIDHSDITNITTKYDVKTIQTYEIKFTYLFNESWGASIGYRGLAEQAEGWNKFTWSGANIGFSYRF